jgi:hypothetical protein
MPISPARQQKKPEKREMTNLQSESFIHPWGKFGIQ